MITIPQFCHNAWFWRNTPEILHWLRVLYRCSCAINGCMGTKYRSKKLRNCKSQILIFAKQILRPHQTGAHSHMRSQGEAKGAMPPQMCRKYSHFDLWVAFFQTKWCYSPKIKLFAPQKNFWASYVTAQARNQGRRGDKAVCKIFRPPWKNVLDTV